MDNVYLNLLNKGVSFMFLLKFCKEMLCFLEKFTQLEFFLFLGFDGCDKFHVSRQLSFSAAATLIMSSLFEYNVHICSAIITRVGRCIFSITAVHYIQCHITFSLWMYSPQMQMQQCITRPQPVRPRFTPPASTLSPSFSQDLKSIKIAQFDPTKIPGNGR